MNQNNGLNDHLTTHGVNIQLQQNNDLCEKKQWHQKYATAKDFEFQKVIIYFLITFVWTWSIWWSLAVIMWYYPSLNFWYLYPAGLIGSGGPLFSSFFLTYKYDGGKAAIFKFLKRGFQFKSIPLWIYYAVIFTFMICDLITSFIVAADINYKGLALFVPMYIVGYIGGPFQEEYGWRGYALDRIQLKCNSLISSLIIGVIWAIWHLPLFFIKGDPHNELNLEYFVLEVVATSVVITWLYNQSQSNITVSILCHMAMNSTQLPFSSDNIYYPLIKGITALSIGFFVIVPIFGYKTFTENMKRI